MIGRAGAHSKGNTSHSDYMNDYSLPLGGYESWQHTLLTGGDTYSVKERLYPPEWIYRGGMVTDV